MAKNTKEADLFSGFDKKAAATITADTITNVADLYSIQLRLAMLADNLEMVRHGIADMIENESVRKKSDNALYIIEGQIKELVESMEELVTNNA